MNRSSTVILLGLYFFCYTIPQGIQGIFYSYDKVVNHDLFLSALNFVSFVILFRANKLKNLLPILKNNLQLYFYVVFLVISCISLLIAENFVAGIVTLTKYFTILISFVMIMSLSQIVKKTFLQLFIIFTLFALVLESVWINYLFYESVYTNGNVIQRSGNSTGFAANINISSFSLALKIPVLFYLIFTSAKKNIQIISIILLFSSFLTIFLLLSRGAILAVIVTLISVLLGILISKNWKYVKSFSLIIFVFYLSFISYGIVNQKNTSDIMLDRFATITSPGEDDSVKERVNFYSTAINSIYNKPLLGVGVGNWKIISIRYSRDIIAEYRVPYFVHNDFLQVTAEIGIFGGLAYMCFIFFPFFKSMSKLFKQKSFGIYFMIFLISGVFIVDSLINFPLDRPINTIYLLFLMTLLYVYSKFKEENEK